MTAPELHECFKLGPQEGKHIDPIKLLQFLSARATVLAEGTAVPGRDPTYTEQLRGQRYELLKLRGEIEDLTNAP